MTTPYLTTEEAAAYLGYETAGAVREARTSGLEPVGRRGPRGPYLYKREDIDLWLKNCLTGGQAPSSSTSSPAVDDGDEYEKNERSRDLPDEVREVSGASNREMPDHGQDAGITTDPSTRRDDSGGNSAARRTQGSSIERTQKRARDYYRSQLRNAVARAKE